MEDLRAYLLALTAWIGRWFPKRPLRYWIGAFAVLALSLLVEPTVERFLGFDTVRNYLFQHLNEATMNRARPGAVKLVMIEDDDYWKPDGTLMHRTPTNRQYLADVVTALSNVNASVIAIDFDMRLSDPYAPAGPRRYDLIEKAYWKETAALIKAVGLAAQSHRVVLARTLLHNSNGYFLAADVVQAYGICVRLTKDGVWYNPGTPEFPLTRLAQSNISCGYIALTSDARQIPPPMSVGQPGRADSFSLAIARAIDPANAGDFNSQPYYATYIQPEIVSGRNITLPSSELIACCEKPATPDTGPSPARTLFQGNAVIVGADWSKSGPKAGDKVDMHGTPVGPVSGAVIHFNRATAAMNSRLFPAVSPGILYAVNAILGVIAVICFAALASGWWRLAALLGATLILFALQWLSLNLFGIFIDAFIPVFGVGLHSIIERLVSRE